ncbi:tetraacyldisaccharide 4'-kinase [Psychrobacter sp. P11G5]|uniref:tetraacyldisaccharide 4'-kinase n=1 Tax=Psychrobacter sp. P11G5 TaxID=1699624 RepID=UPI00078D87EA|nr:tetraacyldisaccharide 4'-kinase [Psychrobacter sp. P11G5]AMN67671.1 tetraacyldisaccharide 4'-kinase [Psychrobacter sp. P11G5]
MSIETAITRAWQRKAAWLWLLLPISWLYGLLTLLRRQAYKAGLFASYRAPVPIMVIGNITVGGSGKTPLIITLVSYLQQQGIKVGVISRGYGGDSSQMPALVTKDSLPSTVGDEPCLIVNVTAVPMAVCPNREQAITTLLNAYPDLQLIIADDGLQHYALQRDIEWIVVDVARGFGNQQLLPTGFLREPMARLTDAIVIYHEKPEVVSALNNNENLAQHLTMQLQPSSLYPLLSDDDIHDLDILTSSSDAVVPMQGSVHAVSGIGYPQRFFATLRTLGFDVIEHPYPDHYDFSLLELRKYTEHPIIVTTKDAVKIRTLLLAELNKINSIKPDELINDDIKALVNRLWVLPVTAELSNACYQKLQQQLEAFGIDMPTSGFRDK